MKFIMFLQVRVHVVSNRYEAQSVLIDSHYHRARTTDRQSIIVIGNYRIVCVPGFEVEIKKLREKERGRERERERSIEDNIPINHNSLLPFNVFPNKYTIQLPTFVRRSARDTSTGSLWILASFLPRI